jgi:hypothetical protein
MVDGFIERRFDLGQSSEVIVRFAPPVMVGDDFRCEYDIVWPDRTWSSKAPGVDAVQALILAMEKAHVELLASDEFRSGQLSWFGSEDLGMPLPGNVTPEDFK